MQIEIRNFSTKTMSVKLFLRSINMLKPQTAQCKKKKKKTCHYNQAKLSRIILQSKFNLNKSKPKEEF